MTTTTETEWNDHREHQAEAVEALAVAQRTIEELRDRIDGLLVALDRIRCRALDRTGGDATLDEIHDLAQRAIAR